MTGGPDMAAITVSLERSLRNCSLNGAVSSAENHHLSSISSLDLNSQISLPYHWEQCLDLKTGEIYYRNWRTGIRAKEDPRITGDFYSEEEEEDDDDDEDEDDESSYDDSEESSSESSPISHSRDYQIYQNDHHNNINTNINNKSGVDNNNKRENVLVVAGCKSCLMYFMVPKQDSICPKCCGQLLHFDQSENGSV